MNYPKLYEPILLSLMAAFILVLAWRQEKWPEWLRATLVVIGLVFLLWAVFTSIDVIVYRANKRLMERRLALARTERVVLIEAIRHLTDQQIGILSQYTPIFELIGGGDHGPLMYLRTMDGNVPVRFIERFLELGGEEYLCPVRQWSEGSREREWAEAFTRFSIAMGWASRGAGPYPAKWISMDRAYKALGYEVSYEEN